jgi:hypothetical protein
MRTYFVQAILGDKFEDLHVKCSTIATRAQIIARARRMTTLRGQWVKFVL